MKKTFFALSIALVAFSMTSCLGDLDTKPLNETDFTADVAYADPDNYFKGLAYIASYWAFTSQNSANDKDIDVKDAGQSELCRQYMILNELSTDALKCVWLSDTYVAGIQYHKWVPEDNAALVAVYTRSMKGITCANEFLLQTEDEKLELRGHEAYKAEVAGYRAEARFYRALYYYLMMDFFGNPPFALPENIGGETPTQIQRADLFDWIETECLELLSDSSDMPAKGSVPYPRATKGAVGALLARMYLNAEVYTGKARWQDAKDMAAKVIAMGYKLHDSYEELFMQDNTESGAAEDEFIFAVEYDKNHAQSWGGTTHLCSGAINDAANAAIATDLGLKDANGDAAALVCLENWNGYHVADDYVARFDLNIDNSIYGYDRATSDKRAFFYFYGDGFDNTQLDEPTGWCCWKFSARYSDGHVGTAALDGKFSSCDFPVFRLAEMYMIYAEADARLNGGKTTDATALGYIKALRDRAGRTMPLEVTLDWILDENAREFMWEGHRRVDLIRYGYFTSMSFPWTLKGEVANGAVALPEWRTIYPLIISDLNVNPNLTQNPGY